jgi:hypothetical protein
MLSSFTNKYIQKSDDLTGVSVSLRSWEEKSKASCIIQTDPDRRQDVETRSTPQ